MQHLVRNIDVMFFLYLYKSMDYIDVMFFLYLYKSMDYIVFAILMQDYLRGNTRTALTETQDY